MTHDYKVWPQFFDRLGPDDKNFEVREVRLDAPVHVGDTLNLKEWNPLTEKFTGRRKCAEVGYILPLDAVPGLRACQGVEATRHLSEFVIYGLHTWTEHMDS